MPASRKLFWNQLADDLIECGRIEDAGRYLERALAAGPDAELIDLLGYTYFLRGDLDEAERYYHQAAESDPTFYGPHLNLAKLAIQRRRRDEALRELNQARLLAPRQYGVLYSLALLYRQLGQTAEADRVQPGDQGAARGGSLGLADSACRLASLRPLIPRGPAAQAREDGWPAGPSVTRERNGQGPAVRVMLEARDDVRCGNPSSRLATEGRPRTRHGHHLLRRISDATADPPAGGAHRGRDRAGRGGRAGRAAGREAACRASNRSATWRERGSSAGRSGSCEGYLRTHRDDAEAPSADGSARHRAARAAPGAGAGPPRRRPAPQRQGGRAWCGSSRGRPSTSRAVTTWPRPPGPRPFASTPSCPRRGGR